MNGLMGLAIITAVIIGLVVTNIKIVPQAYAFVIERLGGFHTAWQVGIHMKLPFIDRVSRIILLKEQVIDFEPQAAITKDNVTIQVDTVIFFQITDPKLYAYGVERPMAAIENLAATTLRNIVGDLELDESLTSRDLVNTKMRAILDEATDPWGIKINRVELKNITPPKGIQEAMEKQMRAERERRESILRSEGEKMSSILIAEGQKQSVILRAEAEKQSVILAAEANKEAAIRAAEGEAESIKQVQLATAQGIEFINKASPSQSTLTLKSLEALANLAEGQATKIIIPSNIQDLSGLIVGLTEAVKK